MLARHYPRKHVRSRLQSAAISINHGAHWCESFEREGLMNPADAAVLESAARVGNLAWALDEMADRRLRRFTYGLQLLYNWLFPIVVVVFGFFVMLIAVAMFLPLIALTQALT